MIQTRLRYIVILLSIFFLPILLVAQGSISGRVINDETGKPLGGASVYINSSTIGTTTNEDGEFKLPSVSNGFYEIVASYVGYDRLVYQAAIQSKDLQITFRLQQKANELRQVVVLSKDGREKWLRVFRENFLGITGAATNCRILNEDEIMFGENTGGNQMSAFSAVPLEIVNNELGYRVYFELADFYYSRASGSTFFYGYSRFEELREGKVSAKFVRNRQRYYLGSTIHFFHALIESKTADEGFLLLNILTQKTYDSIVRASSRT
ncbi:MAG: carboxypeptidase-like regulatory domain-containing protein, partial [Chitinophagaceae bacterium]|nr:carboxypeptidase-like regulatory domain-containing protein [Chitinophagaceae bacterium]